MDRTFLICFVSLACFLLSAGCVQNSGTGSGETSSSVTAPQESLKEERCTKKDSGKYMTYSQAMKIAEKSACAGVLQEAHWCNEVSGTWWIDTSLMKEGCMPACVVDVVSRTAEINWMCTGAVDEPTTGGHSPDTTLYLPDTTEGASTTLYIPPETTWVEEVTTTTVDRENPPQESIHLAYAPEKGPEGSELLAVSGEGFLAHYKGYSFKLDRFIYSAEYEVSKAVVVVQKPGAGTLVSVEIGFDVCGKAFYDARVDDIVIRLQSAEEQGASQEAKVYVWDYKNIPVIKKRIDPQKPDPKAVWIEKVTSEGFTAQYNGYKFKVDRLAYSGMYHPFIVVLKVRRPDGTIKELAVKEGKTYRIDNVNVASPFCGYVVDAGIMQSAAIWVWEGDAAVDTTPQEEIYPLAYTPERPPAGSVPLDLSSEGFLGVYAGYKFRIDYLVYNGEFSVAGAVLEVQKPDGTSTEERLGLDECHKTFFDAQVDDIVVRLISAHDEGWWQNARVYAWNYKSVPVMKKRIPPEKPDPNAILLDLTSEASSEYNGYKFKVASLEYSGEYHTSAIDLYVQRPDGTRTNIKVSEGSSTNLGDINIASPFCGYVIDAGAMQSAAIWVW